MAKAGGKSGFFGSLLGMFRGKPEEGDRPFMEHPTGAFPTATDAMADAIERLRALPTRDQWIEFCAQGAGEDGESEHMATIRMQGDEIAVEEPVNIDSVIKAAGVEPRCLVREAGKLSVGGASAKDAARVLDAIFRTILAIRPFKEEGNDYAVGAEW